MSEIHRLLLINIFSNACWKNTPNLHYKIESSLNIDFMVDATSIEKMQFNIIGISFKQGFGYLNEYVFVPSIHESSMNFTLIILNLRLIEQLSCVTLRTNNQFSTTNGVILSSLVLKTDISRQGLYLTQLVFCFSIRIR